MFLYPFKRRKAMYRKSHRIMPVPKYSKWNITAASLGTEELAHMEMICTIVYQLTKDLSPEEIKASGFDKYYVDHTLALWPQAAGGIPFNACEFQSKGDPITDLTEDLAAEQKARSTYDNILRLVKDQEVADPIRFLRAREIVHFQRFGETKREGCSKPNTPPLGFKIRNTFPLKPLSPNLHRLPYYPLYFPCLHGLLWQLRPLFLYPYHIDRLCRLWKLPTFQLGAGLLC